MTLQLVAEGFTRDVVERADGVIDDDTLETIRAKARQYVPTTEDAFRFVHSEDTENLDMRAGELEELLDAGLANALAKLWSVL